MSSPVLTLENVSKTFRDFWRRPRAKAVQDLSFEVESGEVYGLLGPNGSGKSTSIKMILGLLHPSAGSISLLGNSPMHTNTKARVGYLPEHSTLYPYLDARESLHFAGSLFGLDKQTRVERIDQLLDMVGLAHTGRRRVGEFSKGMARRIGLAQALINNPELVILDEPTSGLDPLGTRQVKDIILEMAKNGKTVLLCSHLLADVEDVCDRISILYGGVERASGPVAELLKTSEREHIELPNLDDDSRRKLQDALSSVLSSPPEILPVRQNLESFFLEVIAQARLTEHESSGASGEGTIAAFLSGDASAE